MRSGLFNFTNAPELAASLEDDPDKVWTADEVLGMAFKRPARLRAGGRVRIQQHQLLPARARRREDRRQAARRRLPGPSVRAARDEEHGAAGGRVERHPRALCTRLHLWRRQLCAGRCALSGRSRGGGEGGHAQAGGRYLAESVGLFRRRRRDLDRRRPRHLDAGAGRRKGARMPTSRSSGWRAPRRRCRARPPCRNTATAS